MFGLAVAAPIKDVGMPPAHAVGTVMNAATSAVSTASGVSFIHDQVTGTPRIVVWQDKQRELSQSATPSSSEETGGTAGATDIRTQLT